MTNAANYLKNTMRQGQGATTGGLPPSGSGTTNRLGRFYITRELGRGTYFTVFLGRDPIIDRDVALKTFNTKLAIADKKQHEQQLINEARAAGRLSHPNIITIHEASSEGGTTYIAMEYLDGSELSKMLEKGHRFSTADVASVIWRLAAALVHAHQNGVIHRDIKPANIFMLKDNIPKLVDFGIARAPNRVSDQPAADAPFTLFHNNLLGTPSYMSPEQALSHEMDERTDIYSLGAVMYEMLTGRKPFQANDTEQLLQMIAYKAPPAPHEIVPNIPMELSQIVTKAMSKRPEKRYQTAEELVVELKRYMSREKRARLGQKKFESEPMPDMSAARPKENRHAVVWIATAAITGILLVAYLVWLR